jgi:molecular chaperone GrpE
MVTSHEMIDDTPDALDQDTVSAGEATSPVDDTKTDLEELNNQYLRLAADFANFRKRTDSEREALLKYGSDKAVSQILPVLDNLERAFQSLTEDSDAKTLFQSFRMLHQQLSDAMKGLGVTPIDAVGEAFDPERHEAVSQQPSSDCPDNSVLQVYQKGYLLHDRVIRPAQVVVAVNEEANAPEKTDSGVEESNANPFAGS